MSGTTQPAGKATLVIAAAAVELICGASRVRVDRLGVRPSARLRPISHARRSALCPSIKNIIKAAQPAQDQELSVRVGPDVPRVWFYIARRAVDGRSRSPGPIVAKCRRVLFFDECPIGSVVRSASFTNFSVTA
jgi:hypothetical protein